jgi:hypothetical protein
VDFTLRARLMAWEEALGGQLDLYYGGAQERSAMKMVVCMPVNSDLECPIVLIGPARLCGRGETHGDCPRSLCGGRVLQTSTGQQVEQQIF